MGFGCMGLVVSKSAKKKTADTGGAGRWLTITYHSSAEHCVSHLVDEKGYKCVFVGRVARTVSTVAW